MKIRVWIWGLLLLVGVGYVVPYKSIDPEFEPYIKDMITDTIKICPEFKLPNQYIIKLVDLKKEHYLGLCKLNPFRAEVFIDSEHWKNGTEDDRVALIWHENFHCWWNGEHNDNVNSYMYESYTPLLARDVKQQYINDIKKLCN